MHSIIGWRTLFSIDIKWRYWYCFTASLWEWCWQWCTGKNCCNNVLHFPCFTCSLDMILFPAFQAEGKRQHGTLGHAWCLAFLYGLLRGKAVCVHEYVCACMCVCVHAYEVIHSLSCKILYFWLYWAMWYSLLLLSLYHIHWLCDVDGQVVAMGIFPGLQFGNCNCPAFLCTVVF